jgi:hypothetical protein
MTSSILWQQTHETHRIEAFYNALKTIGDMDTRPIRGESWFDDLYSTEHSPESEIRVAEGWLDDMDEEA